MGSWGAGRGPHIAQDSSEVSRHRLSGSTRREQDTWEEVVPAFTSRSAPASSHLGATGHQDHPVHLALSSKESLVMPRAFIQMMRCVLPYPALPAYLA